MLVSFPPITTFFNCLHSKNGASPISSTPSGSVLLVKALPLKACTPILFTSDGIVIFRSAEHSMNACSPILVTPSGSSTDFRLVQFENIPIPISVTPAGITISVKLLQSANA